MAHVPIYIVKSGHETVNSSATLQDDDHLLHAIAVGETWQYEWFVTYTAGTTGDLKCAVSVPSNCVGIVSAHGPSTGIGSGGQTATTVRNASNSFATSFAFGGAGTSAPLRVMIRAIVTCVDTAGDVKLQWAQNASNATDTTVLSGTIFTTDYVRSYLRATKVS